MINVKKGKKGNKNIKYYAGRIMLTFILSVVFLIVTGTYTYAQGRFCFKLKEKPIIEALNRIRVQGGYDFTYNGTPSDLMTPISASVNTNSVVKALYKVLRNTNLTFYINEKQIILYKKTFPKNGSNSIGLGNGSGNGNGNSGDNSSKKNNSGNNSNNNLKKKIVFGRVTDNKGRWLKGAYIRILGRTKGVTTDNDGSFVIDTAEGDSLIISYVGKKDKKVSVYGKKFLGIVLKDATSDLSSNNKKTNNILSADALMDGTLGQDSLSQFDSDYLSLMPNLQSKTAFYSSLPGLSVLDGSGEPGANDEVLFIRGARSLSKQHPLILIDGIEHNPDDLFALDSENIEKIEILKSIPATALYASKGANGVVRIKTKNGKTGKIKVSVKMETSITEAVNDLDVASPVDFMKYRNMAKVFDDSNSFSNDFSGGLSNNLSRGLYNNLSEGVSNNLSKGIYRTNLGKAPYYTEEYIEKVASGENPALYPAENWRKRLFDNRALNRNSSINIIGGTGKINYYASLSHNRENGTLAENSANLFNNNIKIDNYAYRLNLKFNISSKRNLSLRLNGSTNHYQGPLNGSTKYGRSVYGGMWLSASSLYNYSLQADPVSFPAYFKPDENHPNPGHIMFGGDSNSNPYAELMKGQKRYKYNKFNVSLSYTENLDYLLKGLYLTCNASASRELYYDKTKSYKPTFYKAIPDEATADYQLVETEAGSTKITYEEGTNDIVNKMYIDAGLSYSKTINKIHAFKAVGQASIKNYIMPNSGRSAESTPLRNINFYSGLSYTYKNKYATQLSLSHEGSSRFDKKHRWKTFPSMSFSWSASKEKFWDTLNLKKWINDFTVNASWGLSGNEYISYYRFYDVECLNTEDSDKKYFDGESWHDGVSLSSYRTGKVGRELANKFEFGFKMRMLKELTLGLDYYTECRSNVLQDRDNLPFESGITGEPQACLAKTRGNGIDLSWNYSHSFKNDLRLSLRGNFNYESTEYSKYDEPSSFPKHSSYVGRKIYQEEGLIATGLFTDAEDIKNSPKQTFGAYGPGDIKYKDLNEDGVIDKQDITGIGDPFFPEIYYGLGINLQYKQWDFACYFQGSGNVSYFVDYETFAPFINTLSDQKGHNALMTFVKDNYWNPAEPDVQTKWPRLTEQKSENNAMQSTWWMYDGSFLRLKSLEVGYSLPKKVLYRTGIDGVRFYVGGTNLLTFSDFKLWDTEMGLHPTWYPTQRTYNFGVRVTF